MPRARKDRRVTVSEVADGVQPAIQGWQRPPFEKGNALGLRHGVYSAAVVDPIAEAMVAELLADDDVAHLRPRWVRWSVDAWGRAEAQVLLWRRHVEALGGFEESLESVTTEESEEIRSEGGRSTRSSTSRQMEAAIIGLERAEKHAAACRARLGLDPMSRARLGRDVMSAKADMATILSQLQDDTDRAAQQEEGK
jgi:hypothetical protein